MRLFQLLSALALMLQVGLGFDIRSYFGNRSHQQNDSSALIPRDLLIGGDDYRSVRLSPDGRTLAYIAPYMGVSNVWIRRLAPAGAPYPLTKQKSRPIQGLTWAFDVDGAQTIIYSQVSPNGSVELHTGPETSWLTF